MDAILREFLRLCDAAVVEADKVVADFRRKNEHPSLLAAAERTLNNLRRIRKHALDGTLRRPSGGTGFGMIRAVGEWAEGLPLLDLVEAVELYYRRHM